MPYAIEDLYFLCQLLSFNVKKNASCSETDISLSNEKYYVLVTKMNLPAF